MSSNRNNIKFENDFCDGTYPAVFPVALLLFLFNIRTEMNKIQL